MAVDFKELWQKVVMKVDTVANRQHILTFFKNTVISDFQNGVVIVGVGNFFTQQFIRERYHLKLLAIFQEFEPSVRDIEYEIMGILMDEDHPGKPDMNQLPRPDDAPKIRKVRNKQEVMVDGEMRGNIMKYELSNYIPGNENRLVHAACMAVGAKPGNIYNPLYVYGGVGLGKTHLLQATGNLILKNHPQKRVIYMTAEKFINEIIDAIGRRHTKPFKDKYRNIDCLIVDDIQFFANKATSEQEFFHTFNELYDNGKQIVMSADRSPRELDGLDDRLRSRFAMGMVIEVCVPDFETRVAILQQKCAEHGEMIDRAILEFIANNVAESVREMIGILISAIAQARLENTTPTLHSVAGVIRKLTRAKELIGLRTEGVLQTQVRTLNDVIEAVSRYYKISREILVSEKRRRDIIIPRQICMFLIREILDQPYETIGENFGGRNHTTVLHSCNKITEKLQVDQRLARDVNALKKEMGVG